MLRQLMRKSMLRLININRKSYLTGPVRKRFSNGAGQVLVEYGIILALVASAIIGVQLYVQRGLQARYRDAADEAIREIRQAKGELHLPLQYEPYYQTSDIVTQSGSQITSSYSPGGISTTVIDHDNTLRTGIRKVLPYSDDVGE